MAAFFIYVPSDSKCSLSECSSFGKSCDGNWRGAVYAFEKIYLGEKSIEDVDWVKQVIESKLTDSFDERVQKIYKKIIAGRNIMGIEKAILNMCCS